MAGVTGIDTSLTGTGLGHWDGQWHRHTIVSAGHETDTYHDTGRRLDRILERIVDWVDKREPDLIVIEHPAFSSNTGHASDRAGLFHMVAAHYRAQWPAVALAFADPRARIGYTLGKFSGSKDAVLIAAHKRFPDADIRNNNEADAVVDAALGVHWLNAQPGVVDLAAAMGLPDKPPARVADCLKRVQWPLSLRN